jgi:hypothetical protein
MHLLGMALRLPVLVAVRVSKASLRSATNGRSTAMHGHFNLKPSRYLSTGVLSDERLRKQLDEINSKFGEAREELTMALESAGTVYFNDEATEAAAVADCMFASVLLLRLTNMQISHFFRSRTADVFQPN